MAPRRPFRQERFSSQWAGLGRHAAAYRSARYREGRLVELSIEDVPQGSLNLPMSAVYPTSAPPGPAGRWLVERLKQCPSKMASLP